MTMRSAAAEDEKEKNSAGSNRERVGGNGSDDHYRRFKKSGSARDRGIVRG